LEVFHIYGDCGEENKIIDRIGTVCVFMSDMQGLYADLKAKGATFVEEPKPQPWGNYAIIQDSEGNLLILREPPKNV
jgi:predicted enzyme related to lactoylglutathione lyase